VSDTTTLVRALRILARDIHCEDGIATQCLAEAADAIERLRLTDEEREVLESLVFVARLYAPERTAGVIQRLLERLGKVKE
jgi:hypothetical protein